ncbi:uncharacterized protein Dsk [Centruroides vittatus]|uniref:uncharacterized protein Dsk n=1 Tax=Centruroides vittatus TaxID=120091 RepID=UPI00350EB0E6
MRSISVIMSLIMLAIVSEYTSSSPLHQTSQLQKLAKMVLSYINKSKNQETAKPLIDLHRPNGSESEDDEEMDGGWIDFEDGDEEVKNVKRQYDDYGHLRFGRNAKGMAKKYDDYGHMRFGK